MLQAGGDAPLPHGALTSLVRVCCAQAGLEQQLLDRYLAVQPLIVCLPHDSHRTTANALAKPVPASNEAALLIHAIPSPRSSLACLAVSRRTISLSPR
jgi:hypothetical protein